MKLTNKKVISKKYGPGLILELKNSKLTIRFKDNSIRTYMYPLGFELDLSFEDTNLQTEIETIIIPKRIYRKNIREDYNNFIKASRIKKNVFLNKVALSISRAQAKSKVSSKAKSKKAVIVKGKKQSVAA